MKDSFCFLVIFDKRSNNFDFICEKKSKSSANSHQYDQKGNEEENYCLAALVQL